MLCRGAWVHWQENLTTLLGFNAFPGSLSLYAFITLFCLESLNMLKRAVFYWSHTPRCKEVKKKKET